MNSKENRKLFRRENERNGPLELVSLDGEVVLKQYTLADVEESFALIHRNRKHLSQYGDSTAKTYPTLKSFEESIRHPQETAKLRFGIRNKEGILVGSINLTPKQEKPKSAEIGYYLGAEFQGKGYSTRAVETLTDYAFDQGGYDVLFGDVAKRNDRSERVLLMAGYVNSEELKGVYRYYAYKDYLKGKGEQSGNQLLRILQRFERPSNFEAQSWKEGRERDVRDILNQVPDYQIASRTARLTERQSQDLLFTLLSASRYDFTRSDIDMRLLSRALSHIGEKGVSVTPYDVRKIRTMIQLGGKDGVIPSYLYAFELAQRVGLSVQDSTAIISHFSVDSVWVAPGYAIAPFVDALKALKVTDVQPTSVKNVFKHIEQLPRHTHGEAYKLLEQALTFVCPAMRITPQELMDAFSTHGAKGESITNFLERFIKQDKRNRLGRQDVIITTSDQSRDKYFTSKAGKLEHAALPYRAQRSLAKGINDLEEMAHAKSHLWEDVAEGFWTFDPRTSTWYSFGGETNIVGRNVRHEMVHYDISELSQQPYLFHIHPEDLEIMLRDPYDDFPSREYRDHLTKFLAATPSGADYGHVAGLMRDAKYTMKPPRSFIVHGLGVTEFMYPADNQKLEKMARESRDLRDEAIQAFRWADVMQLPWTVDTQTIVTELMTKLNSRLPEGFLVRMYPRGSKMS